MVLSTRTDTAGITLDVLGRAEQWEDAMVSWRDCVYKDCEHTKCVEKKEAGDYRENIHTTILSDLTGRNKFLLMINSIVC